MHRWTASEFFPLVDAFHHPFPASAEEYIAKPCEVHGQDQSHSQPEYLNLCSESGYNHGECFEHNAQRQVNNATGNGHSTYIGCISDADSYHAKDPRDNLLLDTSGPLSKLPPEVLDLILSYLSPAALDAARHTCKYWRIKILANNWILSSVLGIKEEGSPPDGSPSGRLSHRNLLKRLDRNSGLASTFQHPDAWRTRFHTRELDFSIPLLSSSLTRRVLVAAARAGTQNGLLVFQLQESDQGTRKRSLSTLVVYCFDSADLPWYAGTVHDVEGQGTLHITHLIETKRHAEWVLKVQIGDTAGLYLLNARDAFLNSGPYYSLKILESLENVPRLSEDDSALQDFNRAPEAIPIGDHAWNILAPFPPNRGVSISSIPP